MEYVEFFNLVFLGALTVAFFIQNNKLKILKTIIDSYQPEKLKQAQEYIDKGTEHKYNLILNDKLQKLIKESSKQFQEINKSFLDQFNELIHFPFTYLKDKSWEEREKYLTHYPQNIKMLKILLKAYDEGELQKETCKESNETK